MTILIPGNRYKLAIAKQSAEGTIPVAAEYIVPMYSGGIRPAEERIQHEVSDGTAYRPGSFKSRADGSGNPLLPVFPDSSGRFIGGHFGTDTKTGAGDPFSHDFTRADTRAFQTVWIARLKQDGSFQWDRVEDAQVKAVEFQYANGQLLKMMPEFIAKKVFVDVAAPTGGVTNVLDNLNEYMVLPGATLKLDVDATPAATTVHSIASGTIRFDYTGMNYVQTDELNPRFIDQGLWSVAFSSDVVFEDYAFYKATYFGSKTASAAAQSQVILNGALDFTFPVYPANANHSLQIKLPAMEFSMEVPDVDAGGGPVRASLSGVLKRPASGAEADVILKNALTLAY